MSVDLSTPHYEFSVGPVIDGEVAAPIGGKRDTREEAATAAVEYAARLVSSHDVVQIKVTEV